jgi:hypothetical protein|tara:strand:+ start:37 stop:315 length:279 start_codon:yes stop_codon:yes gene_type:complete
MAKQLDKDMLRMMTMTERFNYIAAKKRMQYSIDSSNVTCSYSGLPSMEVYKDEPETSNGDDWIDRDDDGGYDSSSYGENNGGDNSYDDSNEY